MKKQRGDSEVGLTLGGTAILLIIYAIFAAMSCHSKWGRAGMADVSWGPIQGCMVKMPDGRWLPEERIREIDLPKPEQK
jgi:hypothetical protein